jgi:hypothetical protein
MFKALLRSNKLESRDHPPRRVAAAQPIGKQESGVNAGAKVHQQAGVKMHDCKGVMGWCPAGGV